MSRLEQQTLMKLTTVTVNRRHSDLDKFRFGHQQHAECSPDVGALQLVQKIVEAGHPFLPVVQLGPRAQVVSLLSELVALS